LDKAGILRPGTSHASGLRVESEAMHGSSGRTSRNAPRSPGLPVKEDAMHQPKREETKQAPAKNPHEGDGNQIEIPEPTPVQPRPNEQTPMPTEIPSAPPVELPPGRDASEGDREWAVDAARSRSTQRKGNES
jgi:hypothetical protein